MPLFLCVRPEPHSEKMMDHEIKPWPVPVLATTFATTSFRSRDEMSETDSVEAPESGAAETAGKAGGTGTGFGGMGVGYRGVGDGEVTAGSNAVVASGGAVIAGAGAVSGGSGAINGGGGGGGGNGVGGTSGSPDPVAPLPPANPYVVDPANNANRNPGFVDLSPSIGDANIVYHQHIFRARFYEAAGGGRTIAQFVSGFLSGTNAHVGP